ncbi:MAG: hypothetical protein H7645_09465 [Candidatus Heimdallarchaeota archaeon]|nr:hypothetical protein [Candidatus Heimdallarchaeota archaeon]MCK4770554.1 hypothetical protein [Candidatus Heimdallarchaeota archaeon]
MIVRYDKEKLERTIQFLQWDFINGNIKMEVDERGDLHFFSEDLKLISIENKAKQEFEIAAEIDDTIQVFSSC